ncbi:BTAD domain-containing putative transcriptional regulator [Mycolicibacterium holsaticum]|uniref:Transcriptional regulator n=1 Tax=Mycolicibacterium holsaticum TaxID=152142 RepID=A0A1E3S2D2_9MYCO|nr:BTAD domain-containing putative transcriptional regulator [Mycolicibacterium holsaticum]ODQ96268.1 transcriptional regulator [Mycolicibacterium holsaticum]
MSAPASVRLAVLGPMRAFIADEVVDVGGRRQRALLARLVLAKGQVVSVDRLADDLWHGEPPPKALAALQVYVSHLRRALEPDRPRRAAATVVVSAAPGYCLTLPVEHVDAWHFEAKLAQAQQEPQPRQRLVLLEQAVALWGGDPFLEVRDALWAAPEVARLDELHLVAVEAIAQTRLALGHDSQVIAAMQSHVTRHPSREGAACLLATALYRTGNQAAALDVLRGVKQYLVDELGLQAGRALRDLESDILRHADRLAVPAPPPTPTAEAPVHPQPPLPPLRGRDDELAVIEQAAREVLTGRSRLVWIGGEAGAGKSALARAAAQRLRRAGFDVSVGSCPETDGAPPGWAWTEVLRDLARDGGSAPQHDALAPLLHDGNPAGESGPFWMATALAAALQDAAARRPLAIVLDDLHRTDGLTLELLRLVTDRLENTAVLLIGTYRPSESGAELETARAALISQTSAHLLLGGLDAAAVAALVADCGLAASSGEVLRTLRERTGGNPLFVREMARLLTAEGATAVGTVPVGVRDVLRRRLARLPGPTVTALRQAAVLGRDVDVDVLAELSGRGVDDLLDALEPAVLAGLLDEPAPSRIRFAHALIRDTLYEDTSLLRRARLHASALAMLCSPGRAADSAELAHHAVAAATSETAVEAASFAIAAARDADNACAPVEAARLWRSALQMLDLARQSNASAVELDAVVEARCGLVSSLARAGDAVTARSELKRALAVVHGRDDMTLRVLLAWDAPLVWRVRSTERLELDLVDPLRRVLGTDLPDAVRARLLVTLFAEVEGADPDAAVAAAAEAVALARRVGNAEPTARRLVCAALNAAAYCALGPDDAAKRDSTAAEFLRYAESSGEADYEAVAHWLVFLSAAARSDLVAAQRHVDLAVARAGTGQLGHLLTVLDIFTAQLTVLAGRPDDGEKRYLQGSARLAEHGAVNGAHLAVIGRISAALARGDLSPLADELLLVHERVSTSVCEAAVLALIAAGRTDEARRLWAGRDPVERSYYWLAMTTLRAHAAALLGDVDEARCCAEELAPYSGRMAGLDNGSLLTGPVDAALAAVEDLLGETAKAQAHRAAADALRMKLAADAARLIG